MPVSPELLARIKGWATTAETRADNQYEFNATEHDEGAKIEVVWFDPNQGISQVLEPVDATSIDLNAISFEGGTIAGNAPSGLYTVVTCTMDCTLESIVARLNDGVAPLTVFPITPKADDLAVVYSTGDGEAPYFAVSWNNTNPTVDDTTLVWSKDGNPIATLSSANILQRAFGYLDASGTGTRLYNTPLINIAPLAPALVSGLAEELPPGEYEVDLYVNGALEGVQTIMVGTP